MALHVLYISYASMCQYMNTCKAICVRIAHIYVCLRLYIHCTMYFVYNTMPNFDLMVFTGAHTEFILCEILSMFTRELLKYFIQSTRKYS